MVNMPASTGLLKLPRNSKRRNTQIYRKVGSMARRPGSGRPSKVTGEIKGIVNDKIKEDNETTAYQLHACCSREATPFYKDGFEV